MKWLGKGRLRFLRGQRGFTLLEVLVAVAILGVIGVAFQTALSTTSKSTDLYQQRVTATSLVQSQLEIIKQAPYADSYESDNLSPSLSLPPGYEILISTTDNGTGKQEITVAVSRDGHHLFKLTTIKADW